MDIKTIGVEEWLNVWEKSATWDIAQSTISSLTAYRTKCVSTLGASAQVDAPFSAV